MKPGGKIGFYDSGLGGLGIMRHVVERLPNYNYVYLGDTARKPFGPKPAAEVRGYVQAGMTYLFDQGCELVIVAGDTAAAQALRFVQQQFLPTYAPGRHVLGIIVPTAQAAVMDTKNNKIGVIATQGTVEAGSFAEEIHKLRPQATVYQQAAPELVSLIESGLHRSPEMIMMLRHYLKALQGVGIDTLVLGCTHYELIAPQIAQIMGTGVQIIHQGQATAERLQDYLYRHADTAHKLVSGSERRFCFTSNAQVFAGLSTEFYGSQIVAEQVKIG